jgi:hypothetical protein
MNLSPGWRRFFVRSGAAFVPLVTVASAFVLFASWAGAVVFLAALLVAIAWGVRPHLGQARQKLRRYDALEAQAEILAAENARLAEAAEKADTLTAENERLKEAAGEAAQQALAAGIEEGKLQVTGSLLGSLAGAPRLVAVSTSGRKLELMAQYDNPEKPVPLGSRFQLQMTATGDRKGVVQVVRVDQAQQMVFLQAVERTVPEYWERLEDEAVANFAPPQGVRLTPVQYSPARALMPPAPTLLSRLLRMPDQEGRER